MEDTFDYAVASKMVPGAVLHAADAAGWFL